MGINTDLVSQLFWECSICYRTSRMFNLISKFFKRIYFSTFRKTLLNTLDFGWG